MVYEWPHPTIDDDWDNGHHQWRKITPYAYRELKSIPLPHKAENDFMQSEPMDILANGEGLYVCCCRGDRNSTLQNTSGYSHKKKALRPFTDQRFTERGWRDSNARPTTSDLCEFPHSLDYTFTIGGCLTTKAIRW